MGKRIKFKCIYVLLAPNRSVYIGQTSDPINRKSRYKTATCRQRLVQESLKKYGFDAHEFKIIITLPDSSSREMMDFYETYFYNLYKESGYNLLNLQTPGWHGKPPLESRQRMSESRKGFKPWNTGTKGICKAWNKGLKKADYGNR